MATPEEVKYGMVRSLKEWGVDPTRSAAHEKFYDRAIRAAVMNYHGKREDDNGKSFSRTSIAAKPPQSDGFDNGPEFPENAIEAIEYVLRSEVEDRKNLEGNANARPPSITLDLLLRRGDGAWTSDVELENNVRGNAPFFFNSRLRQYQMQRAFQSRFSRVSLDPLARFIAGDVPSDLFFYHAWFDMKVTTGLAFEAIVASHAIHRSSCACCGKTDALRWSGGQGPGASWKDMECTNCHSTYEVKSKKSPAHIDKDMKYNRVRGGSFFYFNKLRAAADSLKDLALASADEMPSLSSPSSDGWNEVPVRKQRTKEQKRVAKQYLVLVSRSPSWHSGQSVWLVEVVEILYVIPRLQERSFSLRDYDSQLSIGSEIVSKLSTRRKWFNIPSTKFDIDEIAKKLFDEMFTSDARSQFDSKFASGVIYDEIYNAGIKKTAIPNSSMERSTDRCADSKGRKEAKERESAEDLKRALENLTMGDGEWDDFGSEGEFEKAWGI